MARRQIQHTRRLAPVADLCVRQHDVTLRMDALASIIEAPLDAIRREIQELAPGTRLFPYGYMPFATSIGGNAVCFHAPTGGVVWANHDSFGADDITYKDRSTGKYHTVPFTPEHVEQAVVPLADDFEAFLIDLLQDRLEKSLDELD